MIFGGTEVRSFDDTQLTSFYVTVYQSCMSFSYHVLVAHDDERLCRDGCQTFGRDMGLAEHECHHFLLRLVILPFSLPKMPQDPPIDAGFHAFGKEIGAVEDEFAHPFRMLQGEDEADVAAVAESEDVRFRDGFRLHEMVQVVGKLFDGEWCRAAWRVAMTARVDGDDAVFL